MLDRLLEDFCAGLRQAGLGARQVALTAWRVDGTVQEVVIGTGLAMREPAHLRRRDYYRVEFASGVRLWIYRTGTSGAMRWWLHGHLP